MDHGFDRPKQTLLKQLFKLLLELSTLEVHYPLVHGQNVDQLPLRAVVQIAEKGSLDHVHSIFISLEKILRVHLENFFFMFRLL